MFKTVGMFGFEFDYNSDIKCFCDEDRKRIAFLSKNYDEIHLIIEMEDGYLIFHPRWNVNIKTVRGSSKKYIIDVNFSDDLINLDDLPMVVE